MTELLFYHLESKKLEQVLPVLLEKTIQKGWRAVVQVANESQISTIDDLLWTYSEQSFLPHGLASDDLAASHPIVVTDQPDNVDKREARFFVGSARPTAQSNDYERLIYLLDGHDPEAMQNAREDWKALKDIFASTYWQQDANGRWEKKA